jgi:hypothetical protein
VSYLPVIAQVIASKLLKSVQKNANCNKGSITHSGVIVKAVRYAPDYTSRYFQVLALRNIFTIIKA